MIHENIVIDDIDQAVHVVEPLVDLVRLIGFRKKPCTHVLRRIILSCTTVWAAR